MKWLAVFIAIGSIVEGATLIYWPKPPCPPATYICLGGLFEVLVGLSTLVSGIVLFFLIFLANLRHLILSVIGLLINFALALVFLGSSAFGIYFPFHFDMYEPIKIILGIGFLCAGLSANGIKTLRDNRETQQGSENSKTHGSS